MPFDTASAIAVLRAHGLITGRRGHSDCECWIASDGRIMIGPPGSYTYGFEIGVSSMDITFDLLADLSTALETRLINVRYTQDRHYSEETGGDPSSCRIVCTEAINVDKIINEP